MFIPAAQFLTYSEAVELYQLLQEAEVAALVKTCGPPTFPFGDGMYFQLLIEEEDTANAQATVEEFEQQRTARSVVRCPKCGTPDPAPVSNAAWWKRLYYAGTNLHSCPHCGAEFPV
ncbi:hypothetical protein SAMN06265337_0723 [Hymenobacter gelipurpurascens]|uniref:Signal transducing protein n=1 Tax=Hymenobacter gelipurpurascens TaxID=89968 RepID=A0A212T9M4_9BACT|nr:hypothetical protein SAMN06265337_0723 [Hymenobacter gelipurpurascens]